MFKNGLKFAVAVLLLLCLVAMPIFGVSFYDSPSIFSDNAFTTNRQLGKGTSVFLKFTESDDTSGLVVTEEPEAEEVAETESAETVTETAEGETETVTAEEAAPVEETATEETTEPVVTPAPETAYSDEDYAAVATALSERFKAVGYSDIVVEPAENGLVRVDIAQTSFVDSIMDQVACKGDWAFSDPSGNTVCEGSMVKDATVRTSSYGYFIRLEFTEDGAEQFKNNCSTLAASSSSVYFTVDGAFISIVSLSNVKFGDYFTFGSYGDYGFSDYGTASLYCAMIKHGALPAAMEVDSTRELAPTVPSGIITGMIILFAVIFAVFALLLIVKGRTVGLFAVAALLGDVGIVLTFMANKYFQVNIATVIALYLCLIGAGIFFLFTVAPCGKALKEGKSIAPVLSGPVKKMNIRAAWIHLALLAVTIIIWLAASGSVIYVSRAVMAATLANVFTYFALIIFPAYTLSAVQKAKK